MVWPLLESNDPAKESCGRGPALIRRCEGLDSGRSYRYRFSAFLVNIASSASQQIKALHLQGLFARFQLRMISYLCDSHWDVYDNHSVSLCSLIPTGRGTRETL